MNREEFRHLDRAYRPLSFWFWNDRLESDELLRQIAELDEKGFGGFFMHSRPGIGTTYLSDEWMRCVRLCEEEAQKRGMQAWLYDEELWPSGGAGGLVPSADPSFRQKELVLLMSPKRHEVPKAVATFTCDLSEGMPRDIRRFEVEQPALDSPNGRNYLYFIVTNPKIVDC